MCPPGSLAWRSCHCEELPLPLPRHCLLPQSLYFCLPPLPAAFLLRLALALARVPNCISLDKFSYFMLRFLIYFSLSLFFFFCSPRCIFDLAACGISAADAAALLQQWQRDSSCTLVITVMSLGYQQAELEGRGK